MPFFSTRASLFKYEENTYQLSISLIPPTLLRRLGIPCASFAPSTLPNSPLVSTFSMRRSTSGHFWCIRPSTSLIQPFPSSFEVNWSGTKKALLDRIQKGWSILSGGRGGRLDSWPLIHGRNSFCTCECPNRKATFMTKNEGHQEKNYRGKFIANSWVLLWVVLGWIIANL